MLFSILILLVGFGCYALYLLETMAARLKSIDEWDAPNDEAVIEQQKLVVGILKDIASILKGTSLVVSELVDSVKVVVETLQAQAIFEERATRRGTHAILDTAIQELERVCGVLAPRPPPPAQEKHLNYITCKGCQCVFRSRARPLWCTDCIVTQYDSSATDSEPDIMEEIAEKENLGGMADFKEDADEKAAMRGKADIKRRNPASALPTAARIKQLRKAVEHVLIDAEDRLYVPAYNSKATAAEVEFADRILEDARYPRNVTLYWVTKLDVSSPASLNPEIDIHNSVEVQMISKLPSVSGDKDVFIYGNGVSETKGRTNSTYAVVRG